MTVQMITATIDSVNKKFSKNGEKGAVVVLVYDDGTTYKKKIFQWLWTGDDLRPNQKLDIIQWGQLVSPDCNFDEAMEILIGQSYGLPRLVLDLQVDQSDEKFWRIINFGLEGSLNKETTTTLPDDGIPF